MLRSVTSFISVVTRAPALALRLIQPAAPAFHLASVPLSSLPAHSAAKPRPAPQLFQRPAELPLVTPLHSLGGLSLACFLAIECSSGLLVEAYSALKPLPSANAAVDFLHVSRQLATANAEVRSLRERVADLEDSAQEFITFIEMQKDTISRLRRGVPGLLLP
jgi:hypothetical protein